MWMVAFTELLLDGVLAVDTCRDEYFPAAARRWFGSARRYSSIVSWMYMVCCMVFSGLLRHACSLLMNMRIACPF